MKNILLIEPDEDTATILTKALASEKTKVHIARTSQEAVNVADAHKPDLVILELAIPDQNGVAFLHEFRSYTDWSKIPVIVHTHLAMSAQTTKKAWKLLGVNECLYKPTTSLKKLKLAVEEALDHE